MIESGTPLSRGFWTCINERVIKTLTRIPSNGKEIEQTIVSREYNRTMAWSVMELLADKRLQEKGTSRSLQAFEEVSKRYERGVLVVQSQEAALQIFKQLAAFKRLVRQEDMNEEVLVSVEGTGVLVGTAPSSWRTRNFKQLTHPEFLDVRQFVAAAEGLTALDSLSNRAVALCSITIRGMNFAPRDFVILRGGVGMGDDQYGQIRKVFVVSGAEGQLQPFLSTACTFQCRCSRVREFEVRPGTTWSC